MKLMLSVPCVVAAIAGGVASAAMGPSDPACVSQCRSALRCLDVQANVFAKSDQDDVTVDVDRGGNSVVAWSSRRQEDGNYGVYARRLDPLGRPLTGEVHVNVYTESAQRDPAVALAPDGTVWIAWTSYGQDGDRLGVVARRFAADLTAGSAEIAVNTTRDGDQGSPAIAAGPDGTLVVWTTEAGPLGSKVCARLFGADGNAAGPEIVLGRANETHRESVPCVAALPEGGFAVAWARTIVDGSSVGIVTERIGRDGRPVDGSLFLCRTGDAVEPAIASDADGRCVVAWHTPVDGKYRVEARWLDAGGALAGPVVPVAADLGGESCGVAAAMSADGRAILAFNFQSSPEALQDVYAVRFDRDGAQEGAAFQLVRATEGLQRLDQVTGARRLAWSQDHIVAAWHGAGAGEDATGANVTIIVPERLAAGLEQTAPPVVGAIADDVAEPHTPPVWDPKWRPQPPLGGIAGDGPDFGFEAVPGTGWTPPDPEMAVGKDYLVFIVNGQIRIMDKAGATTFSQAIEGAGGFWGGQGAGGFVFDPEAHYDILTDRYWVMCCERTGGQSFFNLAVSDDGNPNGTWHKYRYNVSSLGQDDIDSPELAVDATAVYLTSDHFGPDKYIVVMLPKAPLMAGQAAPPFTNLVINGTQSYGVPMTWEANAPAQYMLQSTEFSSNTTVIFHAIENALGTPTRVTHTLTVPEYRYPIAPTQKGSGSKPTLFEPRFWSCLYVNGSLWAVHHISKTGGNNNTIARWYQFDMKGWPDSGQTPTIVQWGELDPGPGLFAFFPSIAADAQGNAAITFARSGAAEYIGMWRAVRRWNDAPGTFRAQTIVKVSNAAHTSGRWGDYSKTQPDVFKPCTFWGHHEWTPNGSWRTWAGQYKNFAKSDLNEDCVLDIDDFIKFSELFGLGDMKADFNGDGVLDIDDFIEYQIAFGLGL